jgi:hypothetical protein
MFTPANLDQLLIHFLSQDNKWYIYPFPFIFRAIYPSISHLDARLRLSIFMHYFVRPPSGNQPHPLGLFLLRSRASSPCTNSSVLWEPSCCFSAFLTTAPSLASGRDTCKLNKRIYILIHCPFLLTKKVRLVSKESRRPGDPNLKIADVITIAHDF